MQQNVAHLIILSQKNAYQIFSVVESYIVVMALTLKRQDLYHWCLGRTKSYIRDFRLKIGVNTRDMPSIGTVRNVITKFKHYGTVLYAGDLSIPPKFKCGWLSMIPG